MDTNSLARAGCPVEAAAAAMLEAGVRILQFRHKGGYTRAVFELALRVSELCRQAGAIFVVDDRADIALLLDCGLHVGQEDLPPSDARRIIGPDRLLGFSTHNEEQLRAAASEPVDYVALGPIFATRTKDNPDPEVGLDGLRKLRPLDNRPLVAIGGITRLNALAVLEAGADSVAVISDLLPEPCTPQAIRERTQEWLRLVQ